MWGELSPCRAPRALAPCPLPISEIDVLRRVGERFVRVAGTQPQDRADSLFANFPIAKESVFAEQHGRRRGRETGRHSRNIAFEDSPRLLPVRLIV